MLAIGAIGLLSAPSEEYSGGRVVVVVAVSISALPVAVRWFVGGWPSPRWLIAFIVYSDVSITVCLLLKDTEITAIGGTVLFAVVTTLAVVAVPLLPCLLHMLYSAVVLGVVALMTVRSDAASGWVVAAHSLTMLLMFSAPLILMVYVRELRSRARESLVDSLTGLHNRRGLFAAVTAITVTMQRIEPTVLCAVAIDVDGMKGVNDTYGHEIGDLALRNFSQILLSELGPSDVLARWGGEEFILYLCERDQENARAVLEEARKAIAEAEIIPQQQITFSAGIVAMSGDIDTDAASADALLYAAKKAGRNRIAIPRDTIEQRPDELLDYAPKTRRARSSTKTT